MTAEERIKELGIVIPAPPTPAGLYLPCVQTGNLLFIAGQLPMANGTLQATGKVGRDLTAEQAKPLARQCALNALAIARGHLGTLDRVVKSVRVCGFVASAEGFVDHPAVVNGASQLLIDVFGETAGRHARVASGAAELPLGAPVEVEFLFEVL
ncbi:MAG TPA: RidA family protein [Tepidiformaceae bacterium]|jgi:enamine deaminase RidA (YjgF/YER057c/UK114 family)